MEVLVIGAGVMGLSSAILLARAGVRTRVWARDVAPNVTSSVAAAFWEPFKCEPLARVITWGKASFAEFARLRDASGEAGVTFRPGRSVFPDDAPDLWWRDTVPAFRPLAPAEIPEGYRSGYAWTTAIIETPIYIPWLMRQYESLGGIIERRSIRDLDEALADHTMVVNCAGLGARELVPDPSVYPSRGHLVRVEQFGLNEFAADDGNPDGIAYVIPRSRDIILGGTVEDHATHLEPDPRDAQAIIRRCARLIPRVADAKVLGHVVGLRPRRPQVRLELERRAGGRSVIHNYGHGGAGITLSWGCATEVANLVRQVL
jgi:D-amino-acid oxidase